MSEVTVQYGQTLIDIAVQKLGDAERVFELVDLFGLQLTDELAPGRVLLTPDEDVSKKRVVEYFRTPSHFPASADNAVNIAEQGEGVEFWAIEDDFVVQ